MKPILRTSAAVAALLCTTFGAYAGDWEGPYVGVYYGQALNAVNVAGVLAGYNFHNGNFVYGGELDYMASTTSPTNIIFLSGRAGVLASDNLLLFATLGYGWLNGTTPNGSASLGGEFAATDNVSIRLDYLYQWNTAVPANNQDFIRLGAVWNF